jgi:hypothetical protein
MGPDDWTHDIRDSRIWIRVKLAWVLVFVDIRGSRISALVLGVSYELSVAAAGQAQEEAVLGAGFVRRAALPMAKKERLFAE